MQLPIRRYIHMSSNDGDHSRPTASNVVFLEAGDTLIEGSSDSPPDPSQQITRELRPPVSFRGDNSSPGGDNAGVGASGLAPYSPIELSDKARKRLDDAAHQSMSVLGAWKRMLSVFSPYPPIELSDKARKRLDVAARHSVYSLGAWERLQSVFSTVTGRESKEDLKRKEHKAIEELQGSFSTANTTITALLDVIKTVYTSPSAATWGLDPGDGVAASQLAESDPQDGSSPTVDGVGLVSNMCAKLSKYDRTTWNDIITRLQNCDNGAAGRLTASQRNAIYGPAWNEDEDYLKWLDEMSEDFIIL